MYQTRRPPIDELEELLARNRPSVDVALAGREDDDGVDWIPPVDIERGDEAYRIRLEIPGVRREDVVITMEHGVLTVHGRKHAATRAWGQGRYFRRECSYGEFMRRFTLPPAIDIRGARAELTDGLLLISLPWREGAAEDKVEVEIT